MNPIDPVQPTPPLSNGAPPIPPFEVENPNLALVEQGMDVAENEAREADADDFEEDERSTEPEEEIEANFEDERRSAQPPELAAMHEENVLGEILKDEDEDYV